MMMPVELPNAYFRLPTRRSTFFVILGILVHFIATVESPHLGWEPSQNIAALAHLLSCASNAFGEASPPPTPPNYLRAAVRRRRVDRLPPRVAMRTSFAPQFSPEAEPVKETGAKASSNVSGVSQGRREPLLREFLPILARMSRRNFRGWPKSLTTRGSDFEGVPAIWEWLLSGSSSTWLGQGVRRRKNYLRLPSFLWVRRFAMMFS